MKSFIETIAGDTELAQAFRKKFKVFNVPLMNPDGVDNGHWRHNMGGNRSEQGLAIVNQPETKAVKMFLEEKTSEGMEFVFASDFHSTWQDIYYPLDSTVVEEDDLFILTGSIASLKRWTKYQMYLLLFMPHLRWFPETTFTIPMAFHPLSLS